MGQDALLSAAIVVTALAVSGVLAFTPRIRSSRAWKATVTPLSSIMGSGFLVSAPLVAAEAGLYAPFAMAALLCVAFALGAMIRFNIRHAEPKSNTATTHANTASTEVITSARGRSGRVERGAARRLEQASHVVLAGAYVVSVSYYLQLLSAFVLDRFGVHDLIWSRVATTAVLTAIAAVGSAWGLAALERVETYAVGLNLGMIAALLLGAGRSRRHRSPPGARSRCRASRSIAISRTLDACSWACSSSSRASRRRAFSAPSIPPRSAPGRCAPRRSSRARSISRSSR